MFLLGVASQYLLPASLSISILISISLSLSIYHSLSFDLHLSLFSLSISLSILSIFLSLNLSRSFSLAHSLLLILSLSISLSQSLRCIIILNALILIPPGRGRKMEAETRLSPFHLFSYEADQLKLTAERGRQVTNTTPANFDLSHNNVMSS